MVSPFLVSYLFGGKTNFVSPILRLAPVKKIELVAQNGSKSLKNMQPKVYHEQKCIKKFEINNFRISLSTGS